MTCIAEVGIAIKLANLAERCGLKASHVDGHIGYIDESKDPEGKGYYVISFCDTFPEVKDRTERFFGLLGMKGTYNLKGPELKDLEDKVDQALSLAPRARTL